MAKQEWWRGAVIYQIYPRSFCDSNGSGIGDLKGITSKLDYIKSLGVDAVWISPFFKSPMHDFGYDVSDYTEIDPMFGTMEDFDHMLEEMHKRDIKLIVDMVLSHTSEDHMWFRESKKDRENPKSDWYVWADPKEDGTPPNNWMSVFGGSAWEFDTRRKQYYYHQFVKEQPDLNVQNEEVQDALISMMEWWLEKGVDGFRLDALNHAMHDLQLRDNPPKEVANKKDGVQNRDGHPYYWQRHLYDKSQPEMIPFIKKLRKLTDKYPNRMMVAEIGDDNQNARSIEYTDGAERLHTAYNFAILGLHECSASKIREAIEDYFSTEHDSWPSWAFDNHDVKRVATRWSLDENKAVDEAQVKTLLAMLMSLKGTAFIYEGTELGLNETELAWEHIQDPFGKFLWPEDKGRDGCRTPMVWESRAKNAGFSEAERTWLPIPTEHYSKSADRQETDENSILNFTKAFIEWRKTQDILKYGDINFIDVKDENILAFEREYNGKKMLCIFNLSDKENYFDIYAKTTDIAENTLPNKREDDLIILPAWGAYFGTL